MTPVYVYGFTDRAIRAFTVQQRRIRSYDIGGIYVVADREPPGNSLTETALRRQHAIVEAIARRCEALLPARFGSSIDSGRLEAIVGANRATLLDALASVRGREQMTVRLPGVRASADGAPAGSPGRAYLAKRRADLAHPDPELLAAVRGAVAGLIHDERVQPGRRGLRPVVFHLVDSGRVARYRRGLLRLAQSLTPGTLDVSGPWPPFAFTPELQG